MSNIPGMPVLLAYAVSDQGSSDIVVTLAPLLSFKVLPKISAPVGGGISEPLGLMVVEEGSCFLTFFGLA